MLIPSSSTAIRSSRKLGAIVKLSKTLTVSKHNAAHKHYQRYLGYQNGARRQETLPPIQNITFID